MASDPFSRYFVAMASKTLDVLEAFHGPQEELTLEQVTARTGIAHTTALRLLYTLTHRRYLTQVGKRYRLNSVRRKVKVGFGALTAKLAFAAAVTESLKRAAADAGMELIVLDNRRHADTAVENARALVAAQVDVAIEFQRHESVAPVIADLFAGAGIPTVAVHIPQPGAIYFGVDNYRAGWTAGEALARHAAQRWQGKPDLLVLLDIPQGGLALQSRMMGVRKGVEDTLSALPHARVARVDGGGSREEGRRATATVLARHPAARRILISAASDEGALGALEAVREADRQDSVAIVGHEGTGEALEEIARPGSPYLGTVAFFPERYGQGLVGLVLRMLNGEAVAPVQHTEHQFIDRHRLPPARTTAGTDAAEK